LRFVGGEEMRRPICERIGVGWGRLWQRALEFFGELLGEAEDHGIAGHRLKSKKSPIDDRGGLATIAAH
jgi:hypothetical protein